MGNVLRQIRLGLARDIPAFGGANLFRNQTISYPRLFYGNPSTAPATFWTMSFDNLTDCADPGIRSCVSHGWSDLSSNRSFERAVAPGHRINSGERRRERR